MARIVLVHGAWSCGALWGRVPDLLRGMGHHVIVTDLPGHAPGAAPDGTIGLADAARHVMSDLPDAGSILVGHSMGGMVISAAAELAPARVARLVYVAAFLPRDGDSLITLKRREESTIGPAVRPGPAAGTTVLDPLLAAPILCQDAEPAAQAMALGLLRPQSNALQTDRVRLTAARFGQVPRSYVLCRQDRTITPALQRTMVSESPCAPVLELDAGHFPQLSQPEALAQAIREAADLGGRAPSEPPAG